MAWVHRCMIQYDNFRCSRWAPPHPSNRLTKDSLYLTRAYSFPAPCYAVDFRAATVHDPLVRNCGTGHTLQRLTPRLIAPSFRDCQTRHDLPPHRWQNIPMTTPYHTACRVLSWLRLLPFGVALLLGVNSMAFAAPTYPLKVSSDGRHLVDQNNAPFLLQADAAWSLMVGLSDTDVQTYLADRKNKGFNAVLVNLIEHAFGPKVPADLAGDQPFLTPGDFTTPNEKYFAHADWVIQQAAANGIVVLLTPAYLGYACGSEGWCAEIKDAGTAAMETYGRYLGNRYKNFPNIIWVEGGDTSAAANGVSAEVDALVAGIKAADPAHLHTAHCSRQNSALDCYTETWLDVNTTYSDCTLGASKTKTDYNRTRLMPFFFIEGIYEGEGASDTCSRYQAYDSILGGSTGQVFGNNPIWLFGSGWKTALNSSGSKSMDYLGRLFHSRAWEKLVPDYSHTLVTAGYGSIGDSSSYVAAARTSDANTVIAYLPDARTVTVDLTKVSGSQAKAWWFNPATGTNSLIGTFPTTGKHDFTSSASGDSVLVVDNAALGLPAPGTSSGTSSASADVWITKTASAGSVTNGGTLSYTLTVTNNGPDPASAVTVTDALPAGLTVDSVTPNQGQCNVGSNTTVSCALGALAAGTMTQVQLATTASAVTTSSITNVAQVTATEPDPNASNNSDSVTTAVTTSGTGGTSADLRITNIASASSVAQGETLAYTLTVANDGPDPASAVSVTDNLPPGLTVDSVTANQGQCNVGVNTVSCALGALAVGATTQVQLATTASAVTASSIINVAEVAATEPDPNLSNNTDSVTTAITSPTPAPIPPPSTAPPTSSLPVGSSSGGGATSPWFGLALGVFLILRRHFRTELA